MNLNLKLVDNISSVLDFKALLINNEWYGSRNNVNTPILKSDIDCSKTPYIFSTNINDHWPIGTCKVHHKKNIDTFGFWSPFKQHLLIKGTIVNNVIHIHWKSQISINKEIYDKSIARPIKKVTDSIGDVNDISESK